MKLLLTSAGLSTPDIKNKFLSLIGKKPADITVALIPTAADPEVDKWFVDKDKQTLTNLGLQIKEIDLKNQTLATLSPQFQNTDVIWVEGGNTFYLLYWIRKSQFDQLLPQLLSQDQVYVGVGAGSIIVSPSIESAGWKGGDDPTLVKLDNLDGLKLIDFTIFPHYEDHYSQLLEEESQKLPYEVLPLTNDQAVAVTNSTRETI